MATFIANQRSRLGMNRPLPIESVRISEEAMLDRQDFTPIAPTEENIARCHALLQRLSISCHGAIDATGVALPWTKLLQGITLTKGNQYIAVIGSTGEGKSSLINAVLHEKKLIPTSCMRACTSVVTEISYNDLPGASHLAQVEFISAEEWRQELRVLLSDLEGEHESLKDSKSPAAIALSKICAVYPTLDPSKLGSAGIETLMSLPSVMKTFGKVERFEATSGVQLHDKITAYIDSKNEGSTSLKKMQLWPLIRKVAIQTRAEAVKFGTVIVDLPGLLDANAARASIAEKYLQQCDAVWFVANINRAQDNATAKTFFDKELKRQLHLDGTISRLSFICSKTDDIKVSEVRDALGDLDDANIGLQNVDAEFEKTEQDLFRISASLNAADESLQEISATAEEAETRLAELVKSKRRAKAGQTIWPLKRVFNNSRKRMSEPSDEEPAPKRSASGQLLTTARNNPTSARQTKSQRKQVISFEEDKLQPNLSLSDVEELIEDLEQELSELRSDKRGHQEDVFSWQDQEEEAIGKLEKLRAEEWQTCVDMRNKQVTMLIRQNFAEDINEFYVKKYQEAENFDPSQYDSSNGEQASRLPVFCISSRGYEEIHEWQGKKTSKHTRFSTIQQTQIPLLVEHAQQLGKACQNKLAERYLYKARALLLSMRIWADARSGSHMAGTHAIFNDASQTTVVDRFWTDILEITQRTFEQVKNATQTRIRNILAAAGTHGANQACTTARTWRENAWNTYKTTCRHHGHFITTRGRTVDFNNDLTAPFMDYIATQWARLFNQTLREIFNGATIQGNETVARFETEFIEIMEIYGCVPHDVATFRERLSLFLRDVDDVLETASKHIQEKQRGVNRQPMLSIKSDMLNTYEACAVESGSGMYMRMKDIMESSISLNKGKMFRKVTGTVDTNLGATLNEITRESLTELAASWETFRQDCSQFLETRPTGFTVLPPAFQAEIRRTLAEADLLFNGQTARPSLLLANYAEDAEESCMFFPEL